jgi:cytoskeletal protein CcmA (bactofilin family)
MSDKVKRIPIKYSHNDVQIKLINNGNIKMEEDFIFEGSNAYTNIKKSIKLKDAISELKRNINNLDYINNF